MEYYYILTCTWHVMKTRIDDLVSVDRHYSFSLRGIHTAEPDQTRLGICNQLMGEYREEFNVPEGIKPTVVFFYLEPNAL